MVRVRQSKLYGSSSPINIGLLSEKILELLKNEQEVSLEDAIAYLGLPKDDTQTVISAMERAKYIKVSVRKRQTTITLV